MKKLLALILCVMMFVSVIPTSAFASGMGATAAQYNKEIKNMIKNTKTNVENAYKRLVSDEVVYASAKTMDDAIVSLVDGIADPLIAKDKFTKARADAVKDSLRSYFDSTVAKKISDNYYKALKTDGTRDSLKYAQLVADSINAALTDKDFIAGYQAVATYWALASVCSDIYDNLKDARDDFLDGVDSKFQADFAAKYTTLVDKYIDTIDTAAKKAADNQTAYDLLTALVGVQDVARDTTLKNLATTRDNSIKAYTDDAETLKKRDYEKAGGVKECKADYDTAVLMLEAAKKDPYATAAEIAILTQNVATAANALATAQDAYDTYAKGVDQWKENGIKDANKTYNRSANMAEINYELTVKPYYEAYNDSIEIINPWGMTDTFVDYGNSMNLVGQWW